MTDQKQRTQWALDLFHSFVLSWASPAMHALLMDDDTNDAEGVRNAIRNIAPRGEGDSVGWAVFRREIDADWDRRQHPGGFVHTQVGAVFDRADQADTVQRSQAKKFPDQEFIVGEIIERRLSKFG